MQSYITDPKFSFIFSLQSFFNLFITLKDIYIITQHADSASQKIPILFVSGDMDHCGIFGEGVEKAKHIFLSMQEYIAISH